MNDEARKIIQQILTEDLKNHDITIRNDQADSLIITDHEGQYSSGQSMLMAGTFEKIFVKTGFFMVALNSGEYEGKKYIQAYMHTKNKLQNVTKDGIYWQDSKYRAKCPACGDTESFNLMRFDPHDYRDSTCPKCGDTHRVRAMYKLDEGEVF